MFIQHTRTIFFLIQDIVTTNGLTKNNVASLGLTRKNATTPWRLYIVTTNGLTKNNVFQLNGTIFELVQYIIWTNLLTKFHEDRTINVDSLVITMKNDPPNGDHVFQPTGTIFELVQDIMGTNLVTKFHEDWKIIVASRVLTRQMLTPHDGKNAIT
ncbi:hypothetical protein DPMN_024719 [Dreissena polymorpha]|uniref:Uncharacterized protein n=1 Tax=Dreissena polymorpha TaxID=45954 RepID=A0A9D4LPW2_DREPO|nr:hypothetical protein DPMN_024719 [Dreissena polymorpha]